MIHTPEFWQADEADRTALFAPYTSIEADDVTPVNAYQLGLLALQELVRLGLVVKALALEVPPAAPPRRRGRPPKTRPDNVVIRRETGRIEVLHRKLSAAEARALGSRLLEAAAAIDGASNGTAPDGFPEEADMPQEMAEQ
jgi:hypothetical protein